MDYSFKVLLGKNWLYFNQLLQLENFKLPTPVIWSVKFKIRVHLKPQICDNQLIRPVQGILNTLGVTVELPKSVTLVLMNLKKSSLTQHTWNSSKIRTTTLQLLMVYNWVELCCLGFIMKRHIFDLAFLRHFLLPKCLVQHFVLQVKNYTCGSFLIDSRTVATFYYFKKNCNRLGFAIVVWL